MATNQQHALAEVHGPPFTSGAAQTGTWGMLRRTIERYPNRTALVIQHQPSDVYDETLLRSQPTSSSLPASLPPRPSAVQEQCVRLSYAELSRSARFVANDLHQRAGVQRGSTVMACLDSQVESFLLWWACARLGSVLVPVHPQSPLGKKQDMQHFLRVSKAAVVCVQSDESAAAIVENGGKEATIVVAGHSSSTYTTFADVLRHGSTLATAPPDQDGSPDDDAVLLFTSGTTGLPKSVMLTCVQQSGVDGYLLRNSWLLDHLHGGAVNMCMCLPLNHVMGYYANFAPWFTGGCATYPAAAFDVEATLYALARERCNWFPLVPALAVAMANHYDAKAYAEHIHINLSQTGGANVTPAMLQRFKDVFRVDYLIIGFGLTESVPCATWDLRDERHQQGVGTVHPGSILRIVDPETMDVLQRGEKGELWVAGIKTITRYNNDESPQSFVSAKDTRGTMQRWMRTGDYALIDDDDNLHIVSRIKDLIIRGGENLSAPRIEGVLEEVQSIKMAQVVGVKDERSGEAPVAVVEYNEKDGPRLSEVEIQRHVVDRLGVDAAPVRVLTLKDINVEQWPMTLSRKVQKVNLVEPVQAYMHGSAEAQDDDDAATTTLDVIRREWAALVPVCASMDIDDDRLLTAISSMDSTAFVGRIRKKLGKTLSFAMLQQHPSMKQQAELLDSLTGDDDDKGADDDEGEEQERIAKRQDLQPADLAYLSNTIQFDALKDRVVANLGSINDTLSWSAVESVVPMSAMSKLTQVVRRPRGGNHRHNFYTAHKSPDEVRHNVREAVRCTPMLRCCAVTLNERWSVFVVLRATEAVLRMLVDDNDAQAGTKDDIVQVHIDDTRDGVQAPGMLAKFSVVTLSYDDAAASAGLIMWAHHSAFDFDSLRAICERLDAGTLVHRSVHLDRHLADFGKQLYRWIESPAGRKSAAFHADRLAGYSHDGNNAFWPPQRAPEWMKGCDSGWRDVEKGTLGDVQARPSLGGDTKTSQAGVGMCRAIACDFTPFRNTYNHVFPAFIVKASLVAMNWHATGSADVIFGQYENGRSPTPGMSFSLDCARIDGPLMEMLLNRIQFDAERTTVLELIERVQADQFALMPHAHASIHDIVDAMHSDMDAKLYPDLLRRQLFNWFSNYEGATRFDTLQRINFASHTDLGVLWTVAPRKDNTLWCKMTYDFCQLIPDEAEAAVSHFLCAAKWFADPANANKLVSMCDFACGEVVESM